jgi:hypothetical protein
MPAFEHGEIQQVERMKPFLAMTENKNHYENDN